ncbi:lactadherin-like [Patiria miniata]|uniref:F5/8 type C domain-containing protein n=1 Tax=Patiria miniata TaxID=46514 RepID=A0A914AMP4_PATMI|nr:lactadherin-like [Patiria miniata]
MGDSRIPDDHITASSQYNWVDHAPWKARLTTSGHSAWCSKQAVDPTPWIQVDFSRDLYVTGLVTQGRDIQYDQYVKSYEVAFSGDGQVWRPVTNASGTAIKFAGNTDRVQRTTTKFDDVLRTRFLRIVPKEWNNGCCMSFEVMGCNRTELKP